MARPANTNATNIDEASSSFAKKRQRMGDKDNSDRENAKPAKTMRGSRSKNTRKPDAAASARGKRASKAAGKKESSQDTVTEVVIPMDDRKDEEHERVVFLDNHTGQPVMALHRKKEGAQPMSHLWADFIAETQQVRDHIGGNLHGTFLNRHEIDAIDLKRSHSIFPSLVTSKGCLRSKDNYNAASQAVRVGGVFQARDDNDEDTEAIEPDASNVTKIVELESRAKALQIKAQALEKQAAAYLVAAEKMAKDGYTEQNKEIDSDLAKSGLSYIHEALPLSRKELSRYIFAHEEHLEATAERLRGEMAPLAAYCSKAEKRLRNLIALKVAADLKLCRDIKRFGHFEVQKWQMGALPSDLHECKCKRCRHPQSATSTSAKLVYPDEDSEDDLPDAEDVLPKVKLEGDDSELDEEEIEQPAADTAQQAATETVRKTAGESFQQSAAESTVQRKAIKFATKSALDKSSHSQSQSSSTNQSQDEHGSNAPGIKSTKGS